MRLTLFFLLLSSFSLFAQPPGSWGGRGGGPVIKGKISGTIIDSIAGTPVEFAAVVLINPKDSSQVDGSITETDGSFKFLEVKTGTYNLSISFLGYDDKTVYAIETTPEKPDLTIEEIHLLPAGINLDEITVSAEASLVENRIDKLVYNAEKDATTSGGDAADVLRNVPMLSVDLDGNVSLRGSSNIRILINGRPSTMFGSNPAEALKTIPADEIKSVEVITTPTAKYDGEGSAGIINIITKKKNVQGFTGSVNTSVGTRQNNAGLNLNWVRGRFGLTGGANSFWSWEREGNFEFYREDQTDGVTTVLEQNGPNRNRVVGINGNFGAFYDFNAYNSINSNIRLNGFNSWGGGTTNGSLGDILNPNPITFTNLSDRKNLRNGFDWTTDYRRTYADSEKEFSVAFQVSNTTSNAESEVFQDGTAPRYLSDLFNENDGVNLEYTIQTDYVHPFSDNIKLETGIKGILREIDSDYMTRSRDTDDDPFAPVPLLTDVFNYKQDVYAGYASFNIKLGEKMGFVIGARYERTEISGNYRSENVNPFSQAYENILPSIIINRQLPQFRNLKLSYSQRIQRPSLFYINPFTQITDPNNISFGNPGLNPELVDQFELSYNAFIKGVSINAAAYYKHSKDVIESFVEINPETQVSNTSYFNIGENNSIGLNLFVSANIKQKLTLRAGINIFTYNAKSTVTTIDLSRESHAWSGNGGFSYKLPKDWKFDGFAFARSPTQTLQGENASFWMYGIGIQKEFNKRFTMGLRAIDPFNKEKHFPSDITGENFYQKSDFSIPFRSVGLTLRYNFGQLDFKQQRRNGSKINNNDQKDGGGQDF